MSMIHLERNVNYIFGIDGYNQRTISIHLALVGYGTATTYIDQMRM